jgi:hypothetical protein
MNITVVILPREFAIARTLMDGRVSLTPFLVQK